MNFHVHTLSTAPQESRGFLEDARAAYGSIPNLLGVMAEAPALLQSYQTLISNFSQSSLTPTEQQIVLLATSYENNCEYCVSAHTVIASMQNVSSSVVQALRDGRTIADPKLESLRHFTSAVVSSRGWPSDETLNAFLKAGYTKANALEVVLGVGLKTLSNYTNHLADTPLDPAFSSTAWSRAA